MNTSHPWARSLLLSFCAFLLSACGGGGEGRSLADLIDLPKAPKPADPLPDFLLPHVIAQGVPAAAAAMAFQRYEMFRPKIRNGRFVSLIDFTAHSGQPRLYVIEVATGQVDVVPVAHGAKSDPDDDGRAQTFSNVPNSRKSSLGSYLINEKYYGKYGASMRTDGLEPTNNMARPRAIVMHPSNYVSEGRKKQGRSWGCPAVPYSWITRLIERLRDGSFMFAYSNVAGTSSFDELEINRIMLDPSYRWVNESEAAPLDGE